MALCQVMIQGATGRFRLTVSSILAVQADISALTFCRFHASICNILHIYFVVNCNVNIVGSI